jgi:hypothetical protein
VTSSCEHSDETLASVSMGEVSQGGEKILACQEGKLIGYLFMYIFI